MSNSSPGIRDQVAIEARIEVSLKRAFWSAIGFTFIISIICLFGWRFDIDWVKSIVPGWKPMTPTAAFCFLISALGLATLFSWESITLKRVIPLISGTLLILFNTLVLTAWLYQQLTGSEIIQSNSSLLRIFLSPGYELPVEGSLIFCLIGIIILLMISRNRTYSNIAHIVCFVASIISYMSPLGYIISGLSLEELFGSPVSQISGISFCALCVAVFTLRKDTWLMEVYSDSGSGGMMARKLIPWFIILPIIIAWLRIRGERSGLFTSETGVFLVAITYTISFILLVWFTARSVNKIDRIRQKAVEDLRRSYETLEDKVLERTSELTRINQKLDSEIGVRLRTEKLLSEERERINNLLESLPAYVILLTPDYHVSYSNRFWKERFGASDGKRCFEFLFNRSEPCEICETYKVLTDYQSHAWEWTGPDKRVYSIYDYPYSDSDGSPLIMEMGFDVTDLKKAEAHLVTLNSELEKNIEELLRSNRELEQFAYVASHDLQEPLRMVSSFTQLLSRRYGDSLDQNAHEYIQYAVEGATRMHVLINDLLNYSRISTRSKKYSVVDMHNILDQVIKNLGLKIREMNAAITNDDLPSILADEGQIVLLMQNLIINSLKFTKKTPRIHVSVLEETDKYVFSVRDNGIGIEKQYFDKIFQIFQRLHPREEYGGTGIGLAICKRIVESHGGRIWVESKPHKGSIFYFTILKN